MPVGDIQKPQPFLYCRDLSPTTAIGVLKFILIKARHFIGIGQV